jgi:hypothetical protein
MLCTRCQIIRALMHGDDTMPPGPQEFIGYLEARGVKPPVYQPSDIMEVGRLQCDP